MREKRAPHEIIAELASAYSKLPDAELLRKLDSVPELPDESDAAWNDEALWKSAAYPYLALADVFAERRLRAAILPLLARACYGDPGEIMRGLRHNLEAIVNPEWDALTEVCLEAARLPRLGTKLWSLSQLAILEDERARPLFLEALDHEKEAIRAEGRRGLERLGRRTPE